MSHVSSPVVESDPLKPLRKRLLKARSRLTALLGEQEDVNRRLKAERETIRILTGELETKEAALQRTAIVITEHAQLRYLERVKGIDLEAIRAEMLPPEVEQMALQVGKGKVEMTAAENGAKYALIVKDGRVMTVAPMD